MNSVIYKKKYPLIVFLLPAFAFMIIYLHYPFLKNILNSFVEISGLGTAAGDFNDPWYSNYSKMLYDPNMHTALKNTGYLILTTIIFQVGIALLLALLVDRIRKGAEFFRTIYFFPIVISGTALGLMFNLIFLYNGGMLNQLLIKTNIIKEFIDWKDEKYFLFTMLLPVIWQYVGFYFVIMVTGLGNISSEIYEAASLDGADGWKTTWYISLPLMKNVLYTCLILAITGALKVFDLPWVMMGQGIPMDRSWLTGTYMYSQTFIRSDVDYGSAIAVVIVFLGIFLSQIANHLFREKDF